MLSQRESSAGESTPNRIFVAAHIAPFTEEGSLPMSAENLFNDSEQNVLRPVGLEATGEHGDQPKGKLNSSVDGSRLQSKTDAEHPTDDTKSVHSETKRSVAASRLMSGKEAACKLCKGKQLGAGARQFRQMAYDGWNRTLELSLVISVILGIVAILFFAMALPSRMWRYQSFEYEDSNGKNVSTVNLGLRKMQRIQTLERVDKAGEVIIYDLPMKYDDVINSPYCTSFDMSPATEVEKEAKPALADTSKRDLQEADDETAEATPIASSNVANTESDERQEEEALAPKDLPIFHPFSLTIGRDPALPGGASEDLLSSRLSLLGPTVYDVNCRDLPALRDAGHTLLKIGFAYLAFSVLGVLSGILVLAYTSRRKVGGIRMHALAWFGAGSWLVAVLLHLAGLAFWGSTTDVAACVTSEGGAQVCPLGNAAGAALVTLSFSILAAIAHFMYLAHRSLSKLEYTCQQREQAETSGSQEVPPNSVVIECAPLSRKSSTSSRGSEKASSEVFGPSDPVTLAADRLQELEDFSGKATADETHRDAAVSTEEPHVKPTAEE